MEILIPKPDLAFDPLGTPQHMRKPSGTILIDGKDVASTAQCCHCGCHFIMLKGSGKTRGFCTLCTEITCGDPACHPHNPWRKRYEM